MRRAAIVLRRSIAAMIHILFSVLSYAVARFLNMDRAAPIVNYVYGYSFGLVPHSCHVATH